MTLTYIQGKSPDALSDLKAGSVNLFLTDPPYGTGQTGEGGKNSRRANDHQYGRRQKWGVPHGTEFIAGDRDLSQLELCAPRMAELLAPDGIAFVFCDQARREAEDILIAVGLDPLMGGVQWDKGRPGLSHTIRYCQEQILLCVHKGFEPWKSEQYARRGPVLSPLRYAPVREPEHPNEKPVALLRHLIDWALPWRLGVRPLVCDPFAGIASSGMAAEVCGCDWVGVETDPQWWPIADRRLAEVRGWDHPDLLQMGMGL